MDPNDPASVKILMRENDELEDKIQSIKKLIIRYNKLAKLECRHGIPDIFQNLIYDLEGII
jgi:hypothetical protein